MKYISLIIMLILLLSGCATLAIEGRVEQDKDGNDVYIPEKYMSIKGPGAKKADFNKRKIESDTGLRVPTLKIGEIKTD